MSNPSGRMKVIKYSDMLLPAICAACGRGGKDNSELFCDPSIFYEWDHVQVYFCSDCTLEMATLFGAGPVYSLRNDLANKDAELLQTRAALERAEQLNDNLISERSARRNPLTVPADLLVSNPVNSYDQAGAQIHAGEFEFTDNSQSESQESVNVEGPDDTSESSTDDSVIDTAAILARVGL